MKRWLKCTGVLLIALYSACGATPVPDPPDLSPPDLEQTMATAVTGLVPMTITVDGLPGDGPPGGTVHLVRLGTDAPPSLAIVEEDGSYHAVLDGAADEVLRLSYRSGESRSLPVDGVVPALPGQLTPVRRNDCVAFDPALQLDLGETEIGAEVIGTIVVTNGCGADIHIATRLRAASSVLAIAPPADAVVPAGGSTSIDVTFLPSAAGLFEEVAFVEVSEPFVESYPITVFGVSRN